MLDGGPSRVPQPIDRRAARRPEPPRRYPEDQPTEDIEPRNMNNPQSTAPRGDRQKSPKRIPKPLVAVLLVVLVAALGWLAWINLAGGVSAAIDSNKNQAVFFANGQTYFGKLEIIDDAYMKLSDVFYIQTDTSTEDSEGDNPQQANPGSMQLIKLGQELHGPEDAMVINRDQVLFFENLKDDGRVSQLIKDFESSN